MAQILVGGTQKVGRNRRIVPVLMFHSVGLQHHPWAWSHISEPLQTFQAKIALLKKQGFSGIFWEELYEHMAGRRRLPENSIVLTFDDGYLDNWVHVYPILRKFGMKGTIFVSPDFVDPGDGLRPNLDDITARRCDEEELAVAGFLNWDEMREMEKSGLVDIQSHAMTHTWYFSGPGIVGFHRPHKITPQPWLFWNARPDRKPFYLNEDQQEFLPWGYPILEHEKALVARRFFPDEDVVNSVVEAVTARGGREFFQRSDWRDELNPVLSSLLEEGGLPGSYESDAERDARITDELRRSKALIETRLNKRVDYICWPGGANDAAVQERARAAGYKSWTLSSRSQLGKRNLPGADPSSIKRIGTSNYLEVRGRRCGTVGPYYQVWRVLAHQGSAAHRLAIRARKLAGLGASFFGPNG